MQGFNMGRYHPPSSLDTSLSTTPSTKNPHPLGARARKLPQGILIIRFEMPFAIWCTTCPSTSPNRIIGQGVRFNAEKKKIGNYFSTALYSFRMKHTACGGWIEIRTDPKNTEYIVAEGARKRDTGDDLVVALREGGVVVGGKDEEDERERRRRDAFAALEGKVEDRVRAKGEAERLEDLKSLRSRDWRDPDAAGRRVRDAFRIGRKGRERANELNTSIQDRMNFGFELMDETAEDQLRADLVEFGALLDGPAGVAATQKPLFANVTPAAKEQGVVKALSRKESLHQQLSSNTRAMLDPFAVGAVGAALGSETGVGWGVRAGVKRKRRGGVEDGGGGAAVVATEENEQRTTVGKIGATAVASTPAQGTALVAYESD